MLTITVLGEEYFDEDKNEFVYPEALDLQFEHSLVSLSKWESEFEKPFLGPGDRTNEEVFAYIKAMLMTPDISDEVLNRLSEENLKQINDYIESKQTATWFREDPTQPKSREIITAELLYYWMFTAGIPKECETWHLNRLITLLRVFDAKNQKPKKMSKSEIAKRNKEINERNRKLFGSNG